MSDGPVNLEAEQRNGPAPGVMRQTVDLIIVLFLGVLLFRTFSAEAYVVPTGSMAPTLLGHHRELTCSNCRFTFVVGIDDEGQSPRPVCPNCGEAALENVPIVDCNGDRVLVQKFLFDFRRPRRWEVAVFHFPSDPSQAYVKRVVGLPGEALQIVGGDIIADGQIARKSLQDLRAMRILVHDADFLARDSGQIRWKFRRGTSRRNLVSGWVMGNDGFLHLRPADDPDLDVDDWLEYRHWDPVHRRFGAIRDGYAYNGGDLDSGNIVPDLGIEATLRISPEVGSILVRLRSGGDRFEVRVPVGVGGDLEVLRNGRPLPATPRLDTHARNSRGIRTAHLEASIFDRRLIVALDGALVFEPIDYDDPVIGNGGDESPIALGLRGGECSIEGLRIYRDVYYTSSLGGLTRHPHAVNSPYNLGEDEYFVLGDNSPVSNDSRFWSDSPVVPGAMFLGKPFLVHLPGQAVALEVFGRSLYWVPDPRQIRYIR